MSIPLSPSTLLVYPEHPVLAAAKLSEKPITPTTATAAILLFRTGSPKRTSTTNIPTTNSRRRLLQSEGVADNSAQAEAVSMMQGMVDALDSVSEMLAKGATPADAFIPAGDTGTFVSTKA